MFMIIQEIKIVAQSNDDNYNSNKIKIVTTVKNNEIDDNI